MQSQCPLCSSSNDRHVYEENGYEILRCARCDFMFASPRPSEEALAEYYHAYTGSNETYDPAQEPKLCTFPRTLDIVEHSRPARGRMLDAGCGRGWLMVLARERGWDVCGLGLSEPACECARGMGLEVISGTLDSADFPDESFDVVLFYDFLEHLIDPVAAVRKAARILRPGGLLVVRVPNMIFHLAKFHIAHNVLRDRVKYLEGSERRYFDPLNHINYFFPSTLRRFLAREGFAVSRRAVKNGYPAIWGTPQSRMRDRVVVHLWKIFQFVAALSGGTLTLGNATEIFAEKQR